MEAGKVKPVRRRKKKETVKMFGTGNFYIGTDLYPFRDGETVTAIQPEHVPLLKAEAKRREVLYNKAIAITNSIKA